MPIRGGQVHEFSRLTRIAVFLLSLLPVGLYAQVPCASPTLPEAFRQFGNLERDRIFTDFGNLYNQHNVKNFGVALLGAGVMANTTIDSKFQHWHAKQTLSGFSNELSEFSKVFGEGQYFIPVMITSAITYRFWQGKKGGLPECAFGEFTDRTMRGYFVGFPTLLTMQSVLGGDRPHDGSDWKPFQQNHGVSGHAFIGAVPFMTAAQMTDKPLVKGLCYTLSVLPAWSRVNDDAHYLSQAMLGWYLAYLSVRAVSQTENRTNLPRGLTLFPVSEVGAVGIGLHYQY